MAMKNPKKTKAAAKKPATKLKKASPKKAPPTKKKMPKAPVKKSKIKLRAKPKKVAPNKVLPPKKKIKVAPKSKKALPKKAQKKMVAKKKLPVKPLKKLLPKKNIAPKKSPVKKVALKKSIPEKKRRPELPSLKTHPTPLPPVQKPAIAKPKIGMSIAAMATQNENEHEKDVVFVTEEGLANLRDELTYLKTIKRKELAKRLKEAISYGDLSENSEYEEAKNEQAFIEGRILELDKKIKHAKIIAGEKAGVVRIGSTVTLLDLQSNAKEEYTIVGSTEADPVAKRISNESPVGRALLGKKKGEHIFVQAPGGRFEYEILGIK